VDEDSERAVKATAHRDQGASVLRSLLLVAGGFVLAGCAPLLPQEAPAVPTLPSGPPPTETALAPRPTPTREPPPTCVEREGTWIETTYPGVAVSGAVPVRIYLPSCAIDSERSYPAVYFLHGKPYDESEWAGLGLVDLVHAAAESGRPIEMILVLPRVPEPLFSNSDGGPGSYETEFLDGLVAWVDANYPTQADARSRAVVGISRGGVWALEIALRNPDRLSGVAALSPALAVNYARPPYDPARLVQSDGALPSHVFLGAGDSDWARAATEKLAVALAARGLQPELHWVSGAHADATWAGLLPDVLAFLSRALNTPHSAAPGAPPKPG
jgi:enterochelin esterase-like enzyme